MQLPPPDHELLELLAQGNLRALARDPQEVVRSQERPCLLAYVVLF